MGRGNWKKKQARIIALQEKQIAAFPFKVQVTHLRLRRRAGPSINAKEIGVITDKGIYDIYEQQGDWGRLSDGSWIMLSFTERLKP